MSAEVTALVADPGLAVLVPSCTTKARGTKRRQGQLALAQAVFDAFGRRFDPSDPELAKRPAVLAACAAAAVCPGDRIAWPSRETVATRLGRSVRRLRFDALTEGPDPLLEVHPILWRAGSPGRPGRLFVMRAGTAAETERPPTHVRAHERVGGHVPLMSLKPPPQMSLKPPPEVSECPPTRENGFESDLLSEVRTEPRESETKRAREARARILPFNPETDPSKAAGTELVIKAYRVAYAERFKTPPAVPARERRAVAELIAQGIEAETIAAAVGTYLEATAPYWKRQGYPLRGLVEDWNVWARGGGGALIRPNADQWSGVSGAIDARAIFNEHQRRRRGVVPVVAPAPVPAREPSPEAARPEAREKVTAEVAAEAAARAREQADKRVRAEHERDRHVGSLERCGRCGRALADLERVAGSGGAQ